MECHWANIDSPATKLSASSETHNREYVSATALLISINEVSPRLPHQHVRNAMAITCRANFGPYINWCVLPVVRLVVLPLLVVPVRSAEPSEYARRQSTTSSELVLTHVYAPTNTMRVRALQRIVANRVGFGPQIWRYVRHRSIGACVDVAYVIGPCFGIWEGRVILRSVMCVMIGQRAARAPEQGGANGVVLLVETPRRDARPNGPFSGRMAHIRAKLRCCFVACLRAALGNPPQSPTRSVHMWASVNRRDMVAGADVQRLWRALRLSELGRAGPKTVVGTHS